jgi:hypothetical protein
VHFGWSNKYIFIHKDKKVVLVPLSPEDIHSFDVAHMKREENEKRKLCETSKNSKGETPKPSSHIKPPEDTRLPRKTECLFVSNSDLREVRNTTTPFFFFCTWRSYCQLTIYLHRCQVLFLIYYRTLRIFFQMRCQLVFLPSVALSTKLIWYLVLLFQIIQPTVSILKKQKKFSNR